MITQGNWYAQKAYNQMNNDDTTVVDIIYATKEGEENWFVFSDTEKHGDAMDDAFLIAAAPDLLIAIESILVQINQGKVLERDSCISQARQAYKKAKGTL